MGRRLKVCWERLTRRKYLEMSQVAESKLSRCLTTWDLTILGVGNTLGAGVYVITGQVAREMAGPAVILSFITAALASILAGFCYAEFGARVPKAGSAYTYSYISLGEFIAFAIGWNLILEYVIGASSVASALSAYFDSLTGYAMSTYLRYHVPMHESALHIAPYPDFFAMGILLVMTAMLALGTRESSILNMLLTITNIIVILVIIICGLFKVDGHNWNLSPSEIPANVTAGEGGFFPYGWSGMFSGAAICFYAFIGFDCIATTGEEVKNPQRSIPISILLTISVVTVCYISVSIILTLMVPYYAISTSAAFADAFQSVGWKAAQWFVCVGAICGMVASLIAGLFPLPRVIFTMASDGVLFKFLAYVNDKTQTPVAATLAGGILAALMALLFALKDLIHMMAFGTLLAYTVVAISVIVLRYEVVVAESMEAVDPYKGQPPLQSSRDDGPGDDDKLPVLPSLSPPSKHAKREDRGRIVCDMPFQGNSSVWQLLFNPPYKQPNWLSSQIVKACVLINICLMICVGLLQLYLSNYILDGQIWAIVAITIPVLLNMLVFSVIRRQPENSTPLPFRIPWLPIIPGLSMFANIYLMLKLPGITWIRFTVWMAIGLIIYFSYGMWHSVEEAEMAEEYANLEEESMSKSTEASPPPQRGFIIVDDEKPPVEEERVSDFDDDDVNPFVGATAGKAAKNKGGKLKKSSSPQTSSSEDIPLNDGIKKPLGNYGSQDSQPEDKDKIYVGDNPFEEGGSGMGEPAKVVDESDNVAGGTGGGVEGKGEGANPFEDDMDSSYTGKNPFGESGDEDDGEIIKKS